jgi:hypothetical protein
MFRIPDSLFPGNDLSDSLSRNHSPGNHDEHHGYKKERHNDGHGILDKSHHASYLKLPQVNETGSYPYDQQGREIHHEKKSGHQKGHHSVDKNIEPGKILADIIEALLFIGLSVKSPDD